MTSFFSLGKFFKSDSSNEVRRRSVRSRRLTLEALESRELLSADPVSSVYDSKPAGYHEAMSDYDLCPWIVTTERDVVDDTDGHISLREAVRYAEKYHPNEEWVIVFSPRIAGSTSSIIELHHTLLIRSGDITIDAGTVQEQTVVPGSGKPGEIRVGEHDGEYADPYSANSAERENETDPVYSGVGGEIIALPESHCSSIGITIDGKYIDYKNDVTFKGDTFQNLGNYRGEPIIAVVGSSGVQGVADVVPKLSLIEVTITNTRDANYYEFTSDPEKVDHSFNDPYDGIGVLAHTATLDMRNCRVRGVKYQQLGAINIEENAGVTLTNCVVADNIAFLNVLERFAQDGSGNSNDHQRLISSGISLRKNYGGSSTLSTVQIFNCTIVDNKSYVNLDSPATYADTSGDTSGGNARTKLYVPGREHNFGVRIGNGINVALVNSIIVKNTDNTGDGGEKTDIGYAGGSNTYYLHKCVVENLYVSMSANSSEGTRYLCYTNADNLNFNVYAKHYETGNNTNHISHNSDRYNGNVAWGSGGTLGSLTRYVRPIPDDPSTGSKLFEEGAERYLLDVKLTEPSYNEDNIAFNRGDVAIVQNNKLVFNQSVQVRVSQNSYETKNINLTLEPAYYVRRLNSAQEDGKGGLEKSYEVDENGDYITVDGDKVPAYLGAYDLAGNLRLNDSDGETHVSIGAYSASSRIVPRIEVSVPYDGYYYYTDTANVEHKVGHRGDIYVGNGKLLCKFDEVECEVEREEGGDTYTYEDAAGTQHSTNSGVYQKEGDPSRYYYKFDAVACEVTLNAGAINHGDDFNPNGTPNIITLREAIEYVNCYYDPSGNHSFSVFSDWTKLSEEQVDPTYGTATASDGKIAFGYKTIHFMDDVNYITLERELVIDKSFTIKGLHEGVGFGEEYLSVQDLHVTISGQNKTRIFNVQSGAIVNATDLILTDGDANGSEVATNKGKGGAIYVAHGGKYYAQDGTIWDNKATYGGAVYVAAGGYFRAGTSQGITTLMQNEANYGGAIFIEEGGVAGAESYFATSEDVETESIGGYVLFTNNKAKYGGAVCNKGTFTVVGRTSFENNVAIIAGGSVNKGSFGGAIYNKGTGTEGTNSDGTGGSGVVKIGKQGYPSVRTTFIGNETTYETAPVFTVTVKDEEDNDVEINVNKESILNGYSGGAIYNSSGLVEAYNAEFTYNAAGKYGGAVSNFGEFKAYKSTFNANMASAGGAIQNAGTLTVDGSTFNKNAAYLSEYLLANNSDVNGDGRDSGGNGGAIFTSQTAGANGPVANTGVVTFANVSGKPTKFEGNVAANAGGAIDYISGSMAFGGGCNVTFNSNNAEVIGGAVVAAKAIEFDNSPEFAFGSSTSASDENNVGDSTSATDENNVVGQITNAPRYTGNVFIKVITYTSGQQKFEFYTVPSEIPAGSIVLTVLAERSLDGDSPIIETTAAPVSGFHQALKANSAGFYAPNVAVTCDVTQGQIQAIAQGFFGNNNPGRENLETFARYFVSTAGQITYKELADLFQKDESTGYANAPATFDYKVLQGDETKQEGSLAKTEEPEEAASDSGENVISLSPSDTPYVVRFWDPDNTGVVYQANVLVTGGENPTFMAVTSQFELGNYVLQDSSDQDSSDNILVGVSVRITASQPIGKWKLSWDGGRNWGAEYQRYGFTYNAYNLLSESAYHLMLTADGVTYDLGEIVVKAKTQEESGSSGSGGAILDEEFDFFADGDFVDALFED